MLLYLVRPHLQTSLNKLREGKLWVLISKHFTYSLVDISRREYSELTVNAAPSCEDITNMIRVCPDYSQLGNCLLETVKSLVNDRATETALSGGWSISFGHFCLHRT